MKKKLSGFIAAALLLAMLLPGAALALRSAPVTGAPAGQAGMRAQAKEYQIKFGEEHKLRGNRWTVYSAPSLDAIRGANGKAMLHTSDRVDSAGWYGAWLLVRYEKNNGGYRVGWVPKTECKNDNVEATRSVKIANWTVTLGESCALTDDPLLESETLAYADAGETLTYMSYYCYRNGTEYAYVSGEIGGQPVCGFIPFDAINWDGGDG